MVWLGLVLVGVIAGVFSGMFGIGGGVVIVPILTIFLGFGLTEATSTSLGALLMPVGVFAVIQYYRSNLLDMRASMLLGFGLLATTALGAAGALEIEQFDPNLMKRIYGIFLIVMGWRFAEPRKLYRQWREEPDPKTLQTIPVREDMPQLEGSWYLVLLIGLIAGVFSGMFGIGGGAVIVPMLVGFLNYDQKRAVGTSLGALLLPVGLPGVYVYALDGVLDFPVAAAVAVGLVFGSIVGARVALGMSSAQVKQMYGFFLFAVAIRFIFF